MKTAIYPGSFDPVTLGHLDIIKRSAAIFDKLIIAVLANPRKKTMFTAEERVELIKLAAEGIPNIEVARSDRLLVDFAAERGSFIIVKGLRAVSDFEHEFQMALTNHKMDNRLDTLFLTTNYEYLYLSSSVVKEIGILGGDVSAFLPQSVIEKVAQRFKEWGAHDGGRD